MSLIVLASDHNGISAKSRIKNWLKESLPDNFLFDLGPWLYDVSVDYTDYAKQLSTIIENKEAELGILICGTGVGMSIVANKFPNVRAALVHNRESAIKSKEHNDSNVICLGSWINSDEENIELVRIWLSQKFGEHRHVKRVEKISSRPNNKIVFANGCFDILHAGHIQLLRFAKLLGDYLIVGLDSDRSVAGLKGEGRPIVSQEDRKAVLESIRYVDEVIIHDYPASLVELLNPHIVVKGGDYTAEEIRSRDEIPEHIQIKIFPQYKQLSTTSIVSQIKEG